MFRIIALTSFVRANKKTQPPNDGELSFYALIPDPKTDFSQFG